MPSGPHNLLAKTDRALAAYLIQAGAGTSADTFPAKRSLDKTENCTKCVCSQAQISGPGNYEVTAEIIVITSGAPDVADQPEDKKEDSDARVEKVFSAFFRGIDAFGQGHELADAITAAARAAGDPDLTIQDVCLKGVETGYAGPASKWIDTLNLELLVSPSNVS